MDFSCNHLTLALLCSTLLAAGVHAQPQPGPDDASIHFTHLTIEDGLSQQSIFSILQDRHGFMWFGTGNGLSKYDGYNFTVYRHDPNDSNSPSVGAVYALLEDHDGRIWIGFEGGGISRFDPEAETFTHFRHDPDDPTSLIGDRIRVLYEDRQGTLWVGLSNGLNRFEPETETFTRLVPDPEGYGGASGFWAIFQDAAGTLWVGGGQGLFRYDPSGGEAGAFTRYMLAPEEETRVGGNWVTAIYEDRQGTLWVGGQGFHRFDRETGTFERFLVDPGAAKDSHTNRVMAIVEDHTGALWVGCSLFSEGGGLNRFDQETGTPGSGPGQAFTRYLHDPNDPLSLKSNYVWSLYEDRQGILWVGTHSGGGLSRVDRTVRQFTAYPFDASTPNVLRGSGSGGYFWTGTTCCGLERLTGCSTDTTAAAPSSLITRPIGDFLTTSKQISSRRSIETAGDGSGSAWREAV